MFSKTDLPNPNDSSLNLSPEEQEVLTKIREKLDELSLLNNLPSEFSLKIEDFCYDDWYGPKLSPEVVKAITSLVLNRLQSLPPAFTLNFSPCRIGDEGAEAIAEVMGESCGTHLTVDLFLCGISERGFSKIAKSLASDKCKLSNLRLLLGQQQHDGDYDYGPHDTNDGQLHLAEVLSSPHCPKGLVLNFNYLTEDNAEKIVKAMQLNTSCLVEFENQDSFYVSGVALLNERNRLLKKYPAYKEQIISFCQKQLPSHQTSNAVPQTFVLGLQNKKEYEEQTPRELVKFFSSIINIKADSTDEATILTINEVPFSSHKEETNTTATLSSLSLAINNNTEFTVFVNPQIAILSSELEELMSLLQQTALRNRLIKELKIENNEKFFDPGQFSYLLLQSLHAIKSDITPEISELSLQYFRAVLSVKNQANIFEKDIFFLLAVKTGLTPIARQLYYLLPDKTISDDEKLHLSAIESGSEELMLWLNDETTSTGKPFLTRQTIDFAEKTMTSNSLESEDLSKGLMVITKLIKDFEKQRIDAERQRMQELIKSKNANQLQNFLSSLSNHI